MKEILIHSIKCILFYIGLIAIWHFVPWLGIFLLILYSPIFIFEGYKFFKGLHQSNLDNIQEQISLIQDTWIADISNQVRDNWDLNSKIVTPFSKWGCRIYIQQDEDGNVLDTEIQECSIRDKRKASRIKKSLVKAVLKTSPLPSPEDETAFTRQIYFDFCASN